MSKKQLKEFLNENLLDEKIFIVSGITVGRQMVNRLAFQGQPSINLEIATLQGLAFEICQEYLSDGDKLIVDDILGNNIILGILKDLSNKLGDKFFFKKNIIDANTAKAVYRVILELKLNGLKDFPKIKDLDKIFEEYKLRLESLKAVDYSDIISIASELDTLKRYKNKKIAVASNIEFYNIEKELFEKLTEKNCTRIVMPVDSIENKPKNYYYKDEDTSENLNHKNIFFKDEYGTRNEINYVIEDIKKKRIKLDDVVIAYTNGKYADLINIEFEKNNIPITFGEGLGIKPSSSYRFIETLAEWSSDYFNVNKIKSIFINGDIKIYSEDGKSISNQMLYNELLRRNIGFGRENYLSELKRPIKEEMFFDINPLTEFFTDLFSAIPENKLVNIRDYISRLINLIDKYVDNINKFDGAAKIEILRTLEKIQDVHMEVTREEYFDIVISYIETSRVFRAQPQPGHVFTSDFKNCGYSGRSNLYLIGLDSNSLSNKVIESPILLDYTRQEISNSLSSSKDVFEYKKYKIKELLTADFNNITLIHSNFNTTDVKEMSPSQIYIELKNKYGSDDLEKQDIDWENSMDIVESQNYSESKDKNYRDKSNRKSREFTIFGRDLVKSASALETLAECSRKAYFKHRLNLKAKEETEIVVNRWLNPLEKGIVVHRVLNIYLDSEEIVDLEEVVNSQSSEMREEKVCVLEDVYIREKQEILEDCNRIIDITEKDNEWEIFANELSFGEPLPQKLDIMGLELEIRGSIDRVDRNKKNPNLFRIIDYKTGSFKNFEKKLREKIDKEFDYSNTKKLQYYVYKKALESILEDNKDLYPDFKVAGFNYIFGFDKGKNKQNSLISLDFDEEFIETIENRIKGLLDINILEADKDIYYDGNEKNSICKYCEYKYICINDIEVNNNGE